MDITVQGKHCVVHMPGISIQRRRFLISDLATISRNGGQHLEDRELFVQMDHRREGLAFTYDEGATERFLTFEEASEIFGVHMGPPVSSFLR